MKNQERLPDHTDGIAESESEQHSRRSFVVKAVSTGGVVAAVASLDPVWALASGRNSPVVERSVAVDATPSPQASPAIQTSEVVLINMFEVPANLEDAFLAQWYEVRDYAQAQEGWLSTKLHRSLDPHAQFRFINVVQWRSAEDAQRALTTEKFKQLSATVPGVVAHPVLYQVIAE